MRSAKPGYQLISYVSSRASNIGQVTIGDNCFVLEFAVIQPCSKVGNDVFIGAVIILGITLRSTIIAISPAMR